MAKEPEQYPADAASMNTSPHLTREDVLGRDIALTLAPAVEGQGAVSRTRAALPGRGEEDVYVLHFSETNKTLVLNATNRKALQRAFGNKTKSWVGKKVILYHDGTVRCPDGSKGGIRLRFDEKDMVK